MSKKSNWSKENELVIAELNSWISHYLQDFSTNILDDHGIASQLGFDSSGIELNIDMSQSQLYLDIYECLPIVYGGITPAREQFNENLVAWANIIEDEVPTSSMLMEAMPTVFYVYQATMARWDLEFEDTIMLEHVALLGGVDIRTVRNSVAKEELSSIKEDVRGVCVNSADAKAWLEGRKGFIPTVWDVSDPNSLSGIDRKKQELYSYIEKKSKSAGFESLSSLCTAIKWGPDTLSLRAFFDSDKDCPFSIEQSAVLANVLKLKEREFTLRVMRIYFPETLKIINPK